MKQWTTGLIFFSLLSISGCSKNPIGESSLSLISKSSSREWKPKEAWTFRDHDPLYSLNNPTEKDVLGLQTLLDLALQNNPLTKITWEKARVAASDYAISLAKYFPEIDFEADVTKQHQSFGVIGDQAANTGSILLGTETENAQGDTTSITEGIDNETSAGPTAVLTYTLWDFGQRKANAQSFLYALYESNWIHNDSIQIVLKTVMDDFYNYLYQKALLDSFYTDLGDAEESMNAAQTKLQNGVANVTDYLQARGVYLKRKLNVSSQEANVQNAFVKLANAIGLPSDIQFQTPEFPENIDQMIADVDPEKLLELALDLRPDIRALQAGIEKTYQNLKKAKAELWPTFDTNLSVGDRWYKGISQDAKSYSLELQLNYPLFAGFKYVNQVKKEQAALAQTRAELRRTKLNATKNVMLYYNDFTSAKELVVTAKEYLEAAEEEFEVLIANYEMGVNNIIDVLNGLTTLADARSQYIETKKDLFVAMANLSFATGTINLKQPFEIFNTTQELVEDTHENR